MRELRKCRTKVYELSAEEEEEEVVKPSPIKKRKKKRDDKTDTAKEIVAKTANKLSAKLSSKLGVTSSKVKGACSIVINGKQTGVKEFIDETSQKKVQDYFMKSRTDDVLDKQTVKEFNDETSQKRGKNYIIKSRTDDIFDHALRSPDSCNWPSSKTSVHLRSKYDLSSNIELGEEHRRKWQPDCVTLDQEPETVVDDNLFDCIAVECTSPKLPRCSRTAIASKKSNDNRLHNGDPIWEIDENDAPLIRKYTSKVTLNYAPFCCKSVKETIQWFDQYHCDVVQAQQSMYLTNKQKSFKAEKNVIDLQRFECKDQVINVQRLPESKDTMINLDRLCEQKEKVIDLERSFESKEKLIVYERSIEFKEKVADLERSFESKNKLIDLELPIEYKKKMVDLERSFESKEKLTDRERPVVYKKMSDLERQVKYKKKTDREKSVESKEMVTDLELSLELKENVTDIQTCKSVENLVDQQRSYGPNTKVTDLGSSVTSKMSATNAQKSLVSEKNISYLQRSFEFQQNAVNQLKPIAVYDIENDKLFDNKRENAAANNSRIKSAVQINSKLVSKSQMKLNNCEVGNEQACKRKTINDKPNVVKKNKVSCPICNEYFATCDLEQHAATCENYLTENLDSLISNDCEDIDDNDEEIGIIQEKMRCDVCKKEVNKFLFSLHYQRCSEQPSHLSDVSRDETTSQIFSKKCLGLRKR